MESKVTRYLAAFFISLFIILTTTPRTSAQAGPAGRIANLSGGVRIKPAGRLAWFSVRKGAPVHTGDALKTGADGRAMLELADGSFLSMGNGSELEITEFIVSEKARSGLFSLSTGKLRALIKRFAGSTDIKIKTPTSTSGVKGTDFMVLNKGEANAVFVREGGVGFSGGPGAGVDVNGGEMTENTGHGEPIEPVAVEPGSMLDEVRAGLEAITDVDAPVEWEKAGRLPDILARWNINYGHYLADSKRFPLALEVFRIAVDLADTPSTKAEAHLERGTVLSRNLKRPAEALAEYMTVMDEYPVEPYVENALFSAGMIKIDLGERDGALGFFYRYVKQYPQGSHRDTVDLLIRKLEKE